VGLTLTRTCRAAKALATHEAVFVPGERQDDGVEGPGVRRGQVEAVLEFASQSLAVAEPT